MVRGVRRGGVVSPETAEIPETIPGRERWRTGSPRLRSSTRAGRIRRGSTTTGWAARATARPTGAAELALKAYPQLAQAVQSNRAFLARAVRYLTGEAAIRQFLDIGTGIPAANNTHQVAQREAPDSRIVYVDNDRCKSGCSHMFGLSA